jgi:hypothetical protein
MFVMLEWRGGWVLGQQSTKIRLIEGNAKWSHLKNWPVKGLCCRSRNPYSPFHTVYVYTVYLITQRRGGDSWTREKGRGACNRGEYSTDLEAGLTTWLTVRKKLAVNSDKTCRKVPLQVNFFKWRDFCIDFYESYPSTVDSESVDVCVREGTRVLCARDSLIVVPLNKPAIPWNGVSFSVDRSNYVEVYRPRPPTIHYI